MSSRSRVGQRLLGVSRWWCRPGWWSGSQPRRRLDVWVVGARGRCAIHRRGGEGWSSVSGCGSVWAMFWGHEECGGAGHRVGGRWGRAWLRLVSAFGGGCLLLGGVAACSDAEADPEPEDTPVVDTSVDADGDAAADGDEDELGGDDVEEYEHPVPGPDFDDEGQAGAEAAAVYFVELFHYISASGDFEAWDELTESDCDFCTVARSQVEELYVSGGYSIVEVPVVDGVSSQIWTGSP